jgi:hypothetical protein
VSLFCGRTDRGGWREPTPDRLGVEFTCLSCLTPDSTWNALVDSIVHVEYYGAEAGGSTMVPVQKTISRSRIRGNIKSGKSICPKIHYNIVY